MVVVILQVCTAGVVLVGIAAFLLLCLQTATDFLRDVLSPTTARTVLRSVRRFGLRTLIGLTAAAQVLVAMVLWHTDLPGMLPIGLTSMGCLFFVLWMLWACVFDTVDSLASSKLRRFGNKRRINVSVEMHTASMPGRDDESTNAVATQTQELPCLFAGRRLTWPVREESADSAPHSTSCDKRTSE